MKNSEYKKKDYAGGTALPIIKENMKDNLVEWLAKTGESKEETVSCIIARLEYPYVIDITVKP